jgi:hypothetical protein
MTATLRGLIVGINKYKDIHYREKPLYFARADAEEIASVFHRSNALQVEQGKLKVLINETATHENVWRGLHEVFASGLHDDQNTIALFYFAGHGVIDPIEGDSILLGCQDVNYMNPTQGGVPLNEIYRLVQRTSAGCSIAIIDACFSGGIIDNKRVSHESPAQLARRAIELVRCNDDKTIAIFAACSSDQPAREDPEAGHGVYTNEILHALRDGEARDNQGIVDISGLAAYLVQRFAEDQDWQGPRSVVVGGRRIVLSYGEPRVQSAASPPIHPRVWQKLTNVQGRIELPTASTNSGKAAQASSEQVKARLQPYLLPAGIIMGIIVLLTLLNIFLKPVQHFFLVATFVIAIFLPFAGFIINRLTGILLIIAQIVLLAGFVYAYFSWGKGVPNIDGPLALLAAQVWLFWLLFVVELIVLGAMVLLALMRPSN